MTTICAEKKWSSQLANIYLAEKLISEMRDASLDVHASSLTRNMETFSKETMRARSQFIVEL